MRSEVKHGKGQVAPNLKEPQLTVDEKTSLLQLVSRRVLEQRYIIPVQRIAPFYDALTKGKVITTVCSKCGALYFPPRWDCNRCGSTSLKTKELSGSATLVSFTRIIVKPSSFSGYPDYTLGIGRVKEGVNVLSWIIGLQPRQLRVGMKVSLEVAARKEDGALIYFFGPQKSKN